MSSPESKFVDVNKALKLLNALDGKDPYSVFDPSGGRGFNGRSAWQAYEYPDRFALHRWASEDGTSQELLCVRVGEDGDITGGLIEGFFVIGEGMPATSGMPAKPEIKYRGLVSREGTLDIALGWLEQYGSEEKFSKEVEDLDGIVGILDTARGPILITGAAVAIFGH